MQSLTGPELGREKMKRYLLYISYLGGQFRSVQREVNRKCPQLDPNSVQGILEIFLQKFSPINEPRVVLCSRTDQGVHALKSAVHVDLEAPNGKDYDPKIMIHTLNRCFDRHNIELRVQSCKIVPETFHARHSAKLRSYLYRLAVRRSDAPLLEGRGNKYLARIPYAEWKRCHFIQKTEFDVEKLRSAASLFPGVRDFRTFMGRNGKNPLNVCTLRDMHSLNIAPGQPLLATCYSPCNDDYCFWDITCSAKSFLYRQVRRIVGALVAVAQGSLPIDAIQFMLDNPNANNWNPKAVPVPAYGLYLMNVEYDPADMLFPLASIPEDDTVIPVNSVMNPVVIA